MKIQIQIICRLIALLLVSAAASQSFADNLEGLPAAFDCKNESKSPFAYSIQVETFGEQSLATLTNEVAVTNLARKLKVISDDDKTTTFASLRTLSNAGSCAVNPNNAFAMRCHPTLELSFLKKGDEGNPVLVAVGFSSVWSTRQIHETPFTTWEEIEIMLGATRLDGRYVSERFMIDHPHCSAN